MVYDPRRLRHSLGMAGWASCDGTIWSLPFPNSRSATGRHRVDVLGLPQEIQQGHNSRLESGQESFTGGDHASLRKSLPTGDARNGRLRRCDVESTALKVERAAASGMASDVQLIGYGMCASRLFETTASIPTHIFVLCVEYSATEVVGP